MVLYSAFMCQYDVMVHIEYQSISAHLKNVKIFDEMFESKSYVFQTKKRYFVVVMVDC